MESYPFVLILVAGIGLVIPAWRLAAACCSTASRLGVRYEIEFANQGRVCAHAEVSPVSKPSANSLKNSTVN